MPAMASPSAGENGAHDEVAYPAMPERVVGVLATLADAGHEAALVGGSVRDLVLGDVPADNWDVATSAIPEQVVALFPGATWQNRFGTVTVGANPAVEITSYRAEGEYADRRRPTEVRFGVTLDEDLARRDFTINAMAWLPTDLAARRGRLVDPFGGRRDLADRLLRAVGEPLDRFAEDALRLVRAARFAGRFGLRIDPATEAAIVDLAPTVASVSQERIRDELLRMLALDLTPSGALGLLERLGLLAVVMPELTALRDVPQSKAIPGDALDHTLRAVDAAPPEPEPVLRLTALLHDLGKATTLRDGHFIGHERVGAELAAVVLRPPSRRSRDGGSGRSARSATTCTTTTRAGPMPPCGASSAASTASTARSSSRSAEPTTSRRGSRPPATRTRPSSRSALRNSSRPSRGCSFTGGWQSTATISNGSLTCRPGRRSARSSTA